MEENTIRLVSEALRTCIKALLAASEAMEAIDKELMKGTADAPVERPQEAHIIAFPVGQSQEEW